MTSTTVAAVQMQARPKDVDYNLSKGEWFVEEAAEKGAKLVLLPELFNVGYFIGPELFELWEPEDGRTVTWMREQAARRGAIVAGSVAERRSNRLLNTLFIAEPDGRLHRYAKRQPYKTELAAFDPGDDESIVQTSLGRTGLIVCFDLSWAASLLRPMVGTVDLLLMSQASFALRTLGRLQWWWERRRGSVFGPLVSAIGAPAVVAGMIGPMQPVTRLFSVSMFGGTWVIDAQGQTLAAVPYYEEGIAVAEIVPGSIGGNPNSKTLRDPGFGRDLLDSLVRSFPNLRPRAPSRSELAMSNGRRDEIGRR